MAGDDVTEPPVDPAGEARDRFEDAFERLQARSKRSAELVREGADFDTLTADHAELEMMRREAWRAKKDVVSRYEGATPDYVDVPVGMQDTTAFGRVAAVLGALLLAAFVPLVWFGWINGGPDIDMAIDTQEVVTTVTEDGLNRCTFEVRAGIVNNSDEVWRIGPASAVVDRSRLNLSFVETWQVQPRLVAADSGVRVTFGALLAAPSLDPCPALEDLSRGTLGVNFVQRGNGSNQVRRTANL
jgi:hypothetical protein